MKFLFVSVFFSAMCDRISLKWLDFNDDVCNPCSWNLQYTMKGLIDFIYIIMTEAIKISGMCRWQWTMARKWRSCEVIHCVDASELWLENGGVARWKNLPRKIPTVTAAKTSNLNIQNIEIKRMTVRGNSDKHTSKRKVHFQTVVSTMWGESNRKVEIRQILIYLLSTVI